MRCRRIGEAAQRELRTAGPEQVAEEDADALTAQGLSVTVADARFAKPIDEALIDKLADTQKFAVPEGLVESEFGSIWQRVEEAKKQGQKLDDDEEKMRTEYREIAERRVRLGLLLADVGRSNSIDVTPEELNQAVMREAMRYQGQERQVLEFYGKNPELREQLRAPIFEEKTVDFILELAKVSEKTVTPEELFKAAREAEDADEKAEEK